MVKKILLISSLILVLLFIALSQAKVFEDLTDNQYRSNSNIGMNINSMKVIETSNTEPLDYTYRLQGTDLNVKYCSQNGKTPPELTKGKGDCNQIASLSASGCDDDISPDVSLSGTDCKEFVLDHIAEGDDYKFGDDSTYINITDSEVVIEITPENKLCFLGTNCKSDIIISNGDDTPISFYVSDLDVSHNNPEVEVLGIYYDQAYTIPTYEQECNEVSGTYTDEFTGEEVNYTRNVCDNKLNCTEKLVNRTTCEDEFLWENCTSEMVWINDCEPIIDGNATAYLYTNKDTYITLEAGESKTFTVHANVPQNPFQIYKSDVEFYYGGEWHIIDPNILAYSETPTLTTPTSGNLTSENVSCNYYATGQGNFTNSTDGISRYSLNVDSATQTDSWGSNDGAVQLGATYTASGYLNGAYDFNGSGYINITHNDNFDMGTENFTISIWIKTLDSDNKHKTIISKGGNVDNNVLYPGWILYKVRSEWAGRENQLGFVLQGDSSRISFFDTDTNYINDGNWHHIVISANASSNISIYIDGVLKKTGSTSAIGNTNNTREVWIGGHDQIFPGSGNSPLPKWNGSIDEVQIYNRSLSTDEIAENYALNVHLHNNTNDKAIIDWRKENKSIAVLNMPFEAYPIEHESVDDTIALYYFENDATDETGNHNGFVNGSTYTTSGKVGGAYEFDGVNDYIDLNVSESEISEINFSISLWFYTETDTLSTLIGSRSSGEAGDDGVIIYCASNYLTGAIEGNDDVFNGLNGITLAENISGKWHHAVLTVNADTNTTIMYLDGVAGTPKVVTSLSFTGDTFWTGRWEGQSSLVTGTIDEIQIWNKTLTPSEIIANYDKGHSAVTDAKDYSLNNNWGTVEEAIFNSTGGRDGFGAYEFDGTDDWIDVGNNSFFNLGITNFSFSTWIKTNHGANVHKVILSKGGNIDNNVAYPGWTINKVRGAYSGHENDIQFFLQGASSRITLWGNTVNTINDSNWHHLVVSVDNSSNVSLYIDNVFRNSADASSIGSVDNVKAVRIGGHDQVTAGNSPLSEWNGTIDEVMIFNHTLTAEQISALYQNRTDLIVSQETAVGENYSACVTINDVIEDGTEQCTGNMMILDAVIITYPAISYSSTTPADATSTKNSTNNFNFSITSLTVNLSSAKFNWNGTNYTAFDSNLILGYNFDNESLLGENSSQVIDISGNGNDGLFEGTLTYNATGKYGSCYQFNGTLLVGDNTGDSVIIDGSGEYGNYSIATWFKSDVNDANIRTIFSDGTGSNFDMIPPPSILYRYGTIKVTGGWNGTSYTYVETALTYDDDEWHHLVATFDNSSQNITLYIDGTFVSSKITYTPLLNLTNGGTSSSRAEIGSRSYRSTSNPMWFDGKLDEFRIWNKTINASEVTGYYRTNIKKYNDTEWSLQAEEVMTSDSDFTYYGCATSEADNCTATRTLTLDTTAPTISIIEPTAITYQVNTTDFNVSLNENGGTCLLELDVGVNITMVANNNTWYTYQNTTMSQGVHTVVIYCNDTLDNWGSSSVSFGTDNFPPAITLNYPTNNLIFSSGLNLQFNYTPAPNGGTLDECKLYGNWKNNDYQHYYDFNGDIQDQSAYGNTGTVNGITYNATGGIGGVGDTGAYEFDGNNDYLSLNDVVMENTFSISFWTEPKTTNHNDRILSCDNPLNADDWTLYYNGGSNIRFYHDGANNYVTSSIPSANEWSLITLTYDGTTMTTYLDGTSSGSSAIAWEDNCSNLKFGGLASAFGGNYYEGTMDEIKIYNYSLSSTQVTELYDRNWHSNLTETSPVNDTVNTFTQNITADSPYIFNVWCNESTGNQDFSVQGNFTFIIDTTTPTLNITYPVNDTTYDSYVTTMNVSINEPNQNDCWYSIDGYVTNSSATCGEQITEISSLDTNNTWNYCVNDSVGNIGCSEVFFIVIPDTLDITVNSPLAQSYSNTNISFNVTAPLGDTCLYSLDSWETNTSLANVTSSQFYASEVLAESNYLVRYWCNDTSANINNNEEVNFTVDATAPSITLLSPADQSTMASADQTMTFTVNDALSTVDNCSLNINGILNQTLDTISEAVNTSFETVSFSEIATFKWNVYCTDDAGNTGNAGNFTVNKAEEETSGGGQDASLRGNSLKCDDGYHLEYGHCIKDEIVKDLVEDFTGEGLSLIKQISEKAKGVLGEIQDKTKDLFETQIVDRLESNKYFKYQLIGGLVLIFLIMAIIGYVFREKEYY